MACVWPIMLDVVGRPVVIIGGGAVAARKASSLIEAGAIVRCVAPEFCARLPRQASRVCEPYRPEHLDGAFLAFAATDRPEINEQVVRDARARGILVNRADPDVGAAGDFVTPAVLDREPVTIAVSARSPALAAMIRDRLAAAFDPRWHEMALAMRELRPMIRSSGLPIQQRKAVFRCLVTEEALAVLARAGRSGLRDWLNARYPGLAEAARARTAE